jgi:hypothetical protein
MGHKKRIIETGESTQAAVRREMAKPRMARSARMAEDNLDVARIPQHASVTMPATVARIVPARHRQPEKAQIAVNGGDERHRDLRIENVLIDEHGEDVKLRKGAHVDVTVTGEAKRPAVTTKMKTP